MMCARLAMFSAVCLKCLFKLQWVYWRITPLSAVERPSGEHADGLLLQTLSQRWNETKKGRVEGNGRGSSPSSLTSALARVALATCCVLLASAENFGLALCLLLVSLQTTVTNQERKVNVSICVCLKCKWLSGKVIIIAMALVKLKKKKQINFRHTPPSPYSTSCMNFTHSTAGNEHHESPRTFRSNKPQASFLCCGMENILSILDEQHPLLSLKRKRCLCPLAFFYHSQIILSHKCSLFCLFYLNWTTWYQSLW